jgi:hypothetical protein
MFLLKFSNCSLILCFNLADVLIPLLIEFLVFHDMSLFNFFSLFGLIVYQFFSLSLKILCFKFFNSVLGHFSLYKYIKQLANIKEILLWNQDTYLRTFPPSRIAFCVLQGRHYSLVKYDEMLINNGYTWSQQYFLDFILDLDCYLFDLDYLFCYS